MKRELSSQAKLNKVESHSYHYFASQIIVYIKHFAFLCRLYVHSNPIYLGISRLEICCNLGVSQAGSSLDIHPAFLLGKNVHPFAVLRLLLRVRCVATPSFSRVAVSWV